MGTPTEVSYQELKSQLDPHFHSAIAPIRYVLGQIENVRYMIEHGTPTGEPYHPPGYDGPSFVYVPLAPHYTTKDRDLTVQWFKEQGYRVRQEQRGAHLYVIEWGD